MQNNTDILNELKELSPTLAGLEKVNVFTVPSGYFDVLSDDILASLGEQYPESITSVPSPVDDVPAGYFDNLASNILNKIKMKEQEEETAASELRALSPMLYSIQGENVFEVPHNYFHNLSANTLGKINNATVEDELKIMSPLLLGMQHSNVFEVPQGYFETLAAEIKAKIQPEGAKVIAMPGRRNNFLKYAAAAIFTGIVTLGVIKFTGNEKAATDPVITAGLEIAKKKTFDQELATVTDADIINYLKANADGLDIAAVTNTIDEKELPAQDDYLLDENTLENYLDGVTIDDLKN